MPNELTSHAPKLEFFSTTPRWKEFCLLSLIEEDANLSQHRIARRMGVSGAMINAYIRQFIQKGYLGTTGETNRSIRYNLTPAGRKAKRTLLHLYGREVARLHLAAREAYRRRIAELAGRGIRRVVLFGAATTGDLLYQAATGTEVQIVGVIDNDEEKHGTTFGRHTVEPADSLEGLAPDAVIIAAFGRPQEIYAQIKHLKRRGIEIIRF